MATIEKTAAPDAPAKTEVAKPAVPAKVYQFHPESVNDAWGLANKLAASDLLPKALRNKPADVMIVMMSGHDFGLSAVQSFRLIHVIEGKLFTSAELMRGLVLQSPVCEYLQLVQASEQKVTYKTKRRGHEPVELSYAIEEAVKAGFGGKDNWKRHATDMLSARCSARLCRMQYPDVVGGLYVQEEEEEIVRSMRDRDPIRAEVSMDDVSASADPNRGHDGAMPTKGTAPTAKPEPEEAVVKNGAPEAPAQSAAQRILGGGYDPKASLALDAENAS